MFNPIKKFMEMIDRDVETRVKEDLLKKGITQEEIDRIINDTKKMETKKH